ncbi:MAG: zinc ribbon domain-containing protein [Oscillospiraceae bacterium]|nr:zinc ribbon domain-containing protein [Oscillospiraceae bacterium]
MANFCKKCGTALNPEFGLCPNCDSAELESKLAKEAESFDIVSQEDTASQETEALAAEGIPEAQEKPVMFRGFCMNCGTALDPQTGLCPVCTSEKAASSANEKNSKNEKSQKSKKSKSKEKDAAKDKGKKGELPAVAAILITAFLSLLIFAFTLAPTILLSVRNSTTKTALEEIISEVDMVTVLSEIPLIEDSSANEYSNLYDNLCYNLETGFDIKVTDNRMREFFSDEGVVEDIAKLFSRYAEDVYNGTNYFSFTPHDLADIFYRNSAVFERAFDTYLTREEYELLASSVIAETPEIYPATLRENDPAVMYSVEYGVSYVSIIAMYVLAAVFAVLAVILCKARRGLVGAGLSIGLVGIITALTAFISGAIPTLWNTICGGNEAIASVSAQIINHNLLIFLITLGVGIVIFAVGIVLSIKDASKKAREISDTSKK